jgi:hypothetical protein
LNSLRDLVHTGHDSAGATDRTRAREANESDGRQIQDEIEWRL